MCGVEGKRDGGERGTEGVRKDQRGCVNMCCCYCTFDFVLV